MKKLLLSIICLLGSIVMMAQDEPSTWRWSDKPSSISLTVGAPSMVNWIQGIDSKSPTYFGSYAIRYDYNVLKWLAVGGRLSYNGLNYQRSVYDYDAGQTTEYAAATHYGSVLMQLMFTYINREHVQLYSGIALGLLYYWQKDQTAWSHNMSIAGTVVPIGVHVGNERVYGMAEVSIGTEAMMAIGLGVHF